MPSGSENVESAGPLYSAEQRHKIRNALANFAVSAAGFTLTGAGIVEAINGDVIAFPLISIGLASGFAGGFTGLVEINDFYELPDTIEDTSG